MRLSAAVLMILGCTLGTRVGCFGSRSRNECVVPVPSLRLWWARRHLLKVDEARRRGHEVQLLLVGDSITENYERDDKYDFLSVWNDLLAPHQAMNLGFNGDRTQQLLWRLKHGEANGLAPRDIVLLAGTNNIEGHGGSKAPSTQDVADGVEAVMSELHARMPAARMTVMAILPTGFGQAHERKAAALNDLLKSRVERTDYAHWLDTRSVFLNAGQVRDELYYDSPTYGGAAALHPNPTGQRLMAERLVESLYGR